MFKVKAIIQNSNFQILRPKSLKQNQSISDTKKFYLDMGSDLFLRRD